MEVARRLSSNQLHSESNESVSKDISPFEIWKSSQVLLGIMILMWIWTCVFLVFANEGKCPSIHSVV